MLQDLPSCLYCVVQVRIKLNEILNSVIALLDGSKAQLQITVASN